MGDGVPVGKQGSVSVSAGRRHETRVGCGRRFSQLPHLKIAAAAIDGIPGYMVAPIEALVR